MLSKRVCDAFANTKAKQAAQESIDYLADRVSGLGGLIGINKEGHYAFAHNTPKMAFAYVGESGKVNAFLKAEAN